MSRHDPDDSADYETHDEEVERLTRIIARVVSSKRIEVGGYQEGSSAWQKWMMALCGGLALMGIGAVVGMYGKLSAIEANQIMQAQQQSRMQTQIDGLIQELRRP